MTASEWTRSRPGHAALCRRGVVPFSTTRHPLTIAQRSRNRQGCGQPTTVRKHCRLSAKWRRRQKPVVNNITRVILPPGLGVWDQAWPSPPMDQPQAQGVGMSSQL
jgi:hypothetical protein